MPKPKSKMPVDTYRTNPKPQLVRLTARQKLFIQYYVKYRNGSRAAREAGYAPKNADVEAARLLGNASIRRIVDEAMEQAVKEIQLERSLIVGRLKELALNGRSNYASIRALEMLGDHFGLFEPENGGSDSNQQANEDAVSKALSEFEKQE